MKNRKESIESILESNQVIRRRLLSIYVQKSSKGKKDLEFQITPSQWAVLGFVMRKESVGVKDIAKVLGVTSSAATQLVDELVNKGYLTRESNATDRRALSIKLSGKHKQRLMELKTKATERYAEMFNALDNQELEQYATLNKKIAGSILEK
jgi:DNA-binding MarR family transcriptional regulator